MGGPRLFFIACLVVAGIVAVVLIGGVASPEDVPVAVAAGYDLWQEHSCAVCHTLYGQGGSYAPDLTHIYDQRGEAYLRQFLVEPAALHPDQRLMPQFGMTLTETDSLLQFLAWIGDQRGADYFPHPVIVRGSGGLTVADNPVDTVDAADNSPAALGRAIFTQRCASCHSLTEDSGGLPGPPFAGLADRAGSRVDGLSAESYIRNSIVNPSDFIVDGYLDVMQSNFGEVLTSDDINNLVAFLMTLTANDDGGAS
jgi:mono/diheme cytochrome c family protein